MHFLSEHSFMVKSCGLGGWWWPWAFYCQLSILFTGPRSQVPGPKSQVPSPIPSPSRLTISLKSFKSGVFLWVNMYVLCTRLAVDKDKVESKLFVYVKSCVYFGPARLVFYMVKSRLRHFSKCKCLKPK